MNGRQESQHLINNNLRNNLELKHHRTLGEEVNHTRYDLAATTLPQNNNNKKTQLAYVWHIIRHFIWKTNAIV